MVVYSVVTLVVQMAEKTGMMLVFPMAALKVWNLVSNLAMNLVGQMDY